MPSAPNIEGLPPWLSVLITVIFGIATVLVAVRGYFRPSNEGAALLTPKQEGGFHQLQSAVLTDLTAIRHLSDVCIRLTGQIESFEVALRDQTHWTRAEYELNREICARLRELREVLEQRRGS